MTATKSKSTFLCWGAFVAAGSSAAWVLSLSALVVRAKLADQPFPVLAKFTPFRTHLAVTGDLLTVFPILAILAFALVGFAWLRERSFLAARPLAITFAASLILSLLIITLDPGGFFSWFLS